jgi:Flp pilus assembly pilin Flp
MKGGGSNHQVIVRGFAAERGQAVPEYAVLLSLIAAALIASYQLLGDAVVRLFDRVLSSF